MCNFPPLVNNKLSQIKCFWCPAIQSCSSKKDFLQEAWQRNDCDRQEISDLNQCPTETDINQGTTEGAEAEAETKVDSTLSWTTYYWWYVIFSFAFVTVSALLASCAFCCMAKYWRYFGIGATESPCPTQRHHRKIQLSPKIS
ncbi:Hypothetical predicted protein [Cloeon dipterum]|uniref:Uncharacterized protein n=1 Tax=Cloeon dipterum TaxID=197152 RepID=A0A8S1DV73_9INSE|nr:Hypothetical predicted protein [Cloeon dipterum]